MIEILYIALVCVSIYLTYHAAQYVMREYHRFDNMNKARILAYNAHPFTLFCIDNDDIYLSLKVYSIHTTDVLNASRLKRLVGGFDMKINHIGQDFILRDCRLKQITDMNTAMLENRGVFKVEIAFSSFDKIEVEE